VPLFFGLLLAGSACSSSDRNYLGCYHEKSVKVDYFYFGSRTGNTPSTCNYWLSNDLYGLTNGTECFKINELKLNQTSRRLLDSYCNIPCSGNRSQFCGGNGYYSIYQGTNPQPVTTDPNGELSHHGCFYAFTGEKRTMELQGKTYFSLDALTPAICNALCQGYLNYALQRGSYCYCGKWTSRIGKEPMKCNKPCTGNSSVECGDESYVSVYHTTITTLRIPQPQTPAISDENYVGCFQKSGEETWDSNKEVSISELTAAVCNRMCQGSMMYGMNGRECACFSEDVRYKMMERDESNCEVMCFGDNGNTACGGYEGEYSLYKTSALVA